MSLPSSIRYFYRGPGAILVIILIGLGVAWTIKQSRERADAEKAARQKTRELGQVSPREDVDQSTAAKESVLSNRKLSPGFTSAPTTAPIPNAPVPALGRSAAQLPALVSFYTQVQATPSPTPAPEPRPAVQEIFLPPSIFIPCALVNTIESSHINTPVVAEVIRDVYQNGHLIIPAGTLASSFAQSGAVRDRIEVAGTWLLVFSDGRQLKIKGIACDREADLANQQFGVEDGSAGLQGELVESDHWANAKAFIALLMTSTTQVATSAASSALSQGYGGGVGLPDTTPIMAKYLDQLLNGETGDGRFVRVPASKEFYIFPTDTTFPTRRSVDNHATDKREEPPLGNLSDPMQAQLEMQRRFLRQAQPQPSPENEDSPKFRY
jgi:hypothetical protein